MRPVLEVPVVRRVLARLLLSGSVLVVAGVLYAQEQGPGGERSASGEPLYPIEVHNPPSLGTVDTGLRDVTGASVGVACATCHDPDHPDALARIGEVPHDFHGAIEIEHGTLNCRSCHDYEDRSKLKLADGETLPMRDVLQLCGQCHGPQLRNFWKGSHGGGRGYWDRTRGPWVRNSCVACHTPHSPALPQVMPAPPPNDRFLPKPHLPEHAGAQTESAHHE